MRGWMSLSGVLNTHLMLAYMLRMHGTDEQKQYFCRRWRAASIAAALR